MTCSKTACVPQKQPPANMATSDAGFGASGESSAGTGRGAEGGSGTPEMARATYQTSVAATARPTSVRAKTGGLAESSMESSGYSDSAERANGWSTIGCGSARFGGGVRETRKRVYHGGETFEDGPASKNHVT